MFLIVAWGTFIGGIAYSHLVYFPAYLSDLPNSAVVVNGPYGLHEGIFWAIIHPILIISLIVTMTMNWKVPGRRKLIGITIILYLLALVATAFYFVPELMAFSTSQKSPVPPAEWLARGIRWQQLSWIRGALMYVGMLPLLIALASPSDKHESV